MKIEPTGGALGARIEGIDLGVPVSDGDFRQILRALGAYGVLCFPGQKLETEAFARFGRMFGELEINVANQFHEPGFPEVMVLSNMTRDGKPLGLADAGQGWHTDMSYSRDIALANVLHALQGAAARRPPARRHAVPQHASRLRGPAGRRQAAARRAHRDARLRQVLGHDAGPPGLAARAAHAGAARQEAAGVAADLPHPPDHRPHHPLLQSGLRDAHRRHGRGRERGPSGVPVRAPGAGEILPRPSLGRGRRADVGQHRHRAQRRSGL